MLVYCEAVRSAILATAWFLVVAAVDCLLDCPWSVGCAVVVSMCDNELCVGTS